MKKQELELEVVVQDRVVVVLRVSKQSPSMRAGDKSKNLFTSTNGIRIRSSLYPAFSNETLYILGSRKNEDGRLIVVPVKTANRIWDAVVEYNKSLSEPKFLRTVMFQYNGGSVDGYRRIGVTEENDEHLSGIDLDGSGFRRFLKRRISGPILEVKE